MQHVVLPCAYAFWRLVYHRQEKKLIILADAHHDQLPFSMAFLHASLKSRGYNIVEVFCNYSNISALRSALHAVNFMRLYARAKVVFICDNFLPVSSCRKDPATTVVQLMHSSGLLKRIGYHTAEDIPDGYRGSVYKNYDLVTVSAPCCVMPLTAAMRQAPGIVLPLGTSRTDCYYSQAWLQECKQQFYTMYPEAIGKKIIIWAPTFRGNAANPQQVGMEAMQHLEQVLGDEYFLLKKVHPHVDNRYHLSNCPISTERLLGVADLMITDYSSIVIDFLLFNKPYVLFAPDLEQFDSGRGFYIPYDSLCPYVITQASELKDAVLQALANSDTDWIRQHRQYHLSACDGNATARILDHISLL